MSGNSDLSGNVENKTATVDNNGGQQAIKDVVNANVPQDKVNSKPKTKDVSVENERLRGQISALQKKIDELVKVQDKWRSVFVDKPEEAQNVTPEDLKKQFQELKEELTLKSLEIEKNKIIDELDGVSEARKVFLRREIPAGDPETVKENIKAKLELLDSIIASESKRVADNRPAGSLNVYGVVDKPSANWIREHGEEYKKMHGIS